MDTREQASERPIAPGSRVYDSDGRLLGYVNAVLDDRFEVELIDSDGDDSPGQAFGEKYLMWRCGECGEMDAIEDGLPERCPACGAPRGAIEKILED